MQNRVQALTPTQEACIVVDAIPALGVKQENLLG